MENLQRYLESVYLTDVALTPFMHKGKLPMFLSQEYEFCQGRVQGRFCLFCKPTDGHFTVSILVKHFKKLMEIEADFVPVLWANSLSAHKRAALLNARIPFVIPGKQLFLPFAGLLLSEKYNQPVGAVEYFTPSVQCVYLYLYYYAFDNGAPRWVSSNEIAKYTGLTAMSISRALRVLNGFKLLNAVGGATRKRYCCIEQKAYLKQGIKHLISPVVRKIYSYRPSKDLPLCLAGESALAQFTEINAGRNETYAIDKNLAKRIDEDEVVDMEVYNSGLNNPDNIIELEIWSYNPALFAQDGVVDKISLYASFRAEDDPRIEIAFERLFWEG